jgi:hypothetical protein
LAAGVVETVLTRGQTVALVEAVVLLLVRVLRVRAITAVQPVAVMVAVVAVLGVSEAAPLHSSTATAAQGFAQLLRASVCFTPEVAAAVQKTTPVMVEV